MLPKVSIIIPVYKAQDFLKRALNSCIHQSLKEIEILIIDDCGGDNSLHIAKTFAANDRRITIIENPKNLGTFHTRKRGITQASSQYCMFLDPDDYLHTNACEIAYKAIVKHNVDVVHFGMSYMPKTFKRIKPIVYKGRLEGERMRYFLSARNNTQSLCDKIYKRQHLLQALSMLSFMPPPLNMLEDGLLVLVASFESQSYFGINQDLYYYYTNIHSITKDKTIARFAQKQSHLDKLLSVTSHLRTLCPTHAKLIEKYQYKIASTLMIESRDFSSFELYSSLQLLHKHGFNKTCDFSPYLKSTLLSLCYAFRWQNCVRGLIFICSFGLVRL